MVFAVNYNYILSFIADMINYVGISNAFYLQKNYIFRKIIPAVCLYINKKNLILTLINFTIFI